MPSLCRRHHHRNRRGPPTSCSNSWLR